MNAAQACYGPHDQRVQAVSGVAFGRCLYHLLPEDRFDRQPLLDTGKRWLLVADVRLDNREELERDLDLGPSFASRHSDGHLLLHDWMRWREGIVDRIAGDFAFAVWDFQEKVLVLARDPLGQRPLHYREEVGGFAFASMPSGLHALGIERAPDIPRIAAFLADAFPDAGYVGFSNIKSLPAGHLLRWSDGKLDRRRYWSPAPKELRLRSDEDYVDAFREQIDAAVRSRLRGCDGRVATQLSSGYDSGTVTATAARLLRSERGTVTAFTAAPRLGFDGFVPRGRIADESAVAAMTAALHSNVEHVVVRPDGTSPLELLDDLHHFTQSAGGNICNHVWWTAIEKQASARGFKVLLTGEQGNLTISAGGPQQLADLVRTGRWLTWLREASLAPRGTGMTWKGVLANSLGPWLPRRLWLRLASSHGIMASNLNEPFLLAEPLRSQMMAVHRSTGRDPRPPRNSFTLRCRLLQRQDSGNFRKAALAMWGLDERDPTADPRLIDFCLSLPPDRLLKNGVRRPLAQKALADRLPDAVLRPKARGLQMADWYEQMAQGESAQLVERLSQSPAASALIDFGRVRDLIDRWPAGWEGWDVEADYRGALLRALAAAHFVAGAERPLCEWEATRPAGAASVSEVRKTAGTR